MHNAKGLVPKNAPNSFSVHNSLSVRSWCHLVWILALLGATALPAQPSPPEPIIDVHLHAVPVDSNGPPPSYICAPFDRWQAWDPKTGEQAVAESVSVHPRCKTPLASPRTNAEMQTRTLDILLRYNITAIVSGSNDLIDRWKQAGGERILPAVSFDAQSGKPTVEELRAFVKLHPVAAFAEITQQYNGIAANDARMEPYYALAEELDIPVGIHMGPGPPGISYFGAPAYRMKLSSMLLLEDVLVRHPHLRLWAMHAGWPLGDDAIAALYAHPQLYVDVGVIAYTTPKAEFYSYLKRLVDAGFEDRILFGSDQMVWPEAEIAALETIQAAPFLSKEQKRDILFNNAVRFLRLKPQQ